MKPDDHLTNDDPIAPADVFESPHEENIVWSDPLAADPEDYRLFNEARTPGATYDIHEAHHGPLTAPPPVPTDLGSSVAADRFRPVPLWAIAGCAVLLVWSGLYLGSYSGGFQGDVFNEEANYKPSGPTAPVDPVVASKKRGHAVFVQICAQCHQQDGKGLPGQFPPLVGSEWVLGDAPKRLPQIVLHGIQGIIHVEGNVYNNAMPAQGAVLTDKNIADALTYVRGELGGNSAGPITEQEVADSHKTIKYDDAYSEAELKMIPAGPIDGGATAPGGAAPAPGGAASPAPANVPATAPVPTA